MLQALRDTWIPLTLFVATLIAAVVLLALGIATPYVIDFLPSEIRLFELYAEDAVVRRVSIASGIGMIVTALVFFRPSTSLWPRQGAARKPSADTMAGA
jgi:hypothetical protein